MYALSSPMQQYLGGVFTYPPVTKLNFRFANPTSPSPRPPRFNVAGLPRSRPVGPFFGRGAQRFRAFNIGPGGGDRGRNLTLSLVWG